MNLKARVQDDSSMPSLWLLGGFFQGWRVPDVEMLEEVMVAMEDL